jgi:hypothetical protein
MLVPSLVLEYCTFLLEFIEKDVFPQFKLPMTYKILKALYCNRFEDRNPQVHHCAFKYFLCLHFQLQYKYKRILLNINSIEMDRKKHSNLKKGSIERGSITNT